MDVHKHSAFERLEIVETGRRRRWSEDEKLRIVMESQSAPRLVSATARRHGISRSLLLIWRRSFEAGAVETEQPRPAFVPAMLVGETAPPARGTPASGRMVIEIGERRRVIVDAGVDADALARVLAVLGRQ